MTVLVELFKEIQRIPYRCRAENPSDLSKPSYANCKQKRELLKQRLNGLGYESRDLDAIFDWKDLPLPEYILKILENSGTLQKHHLLEVKIGESYFKIDTTWNLELERFAFPITKNWEGNSDTEQVTTGKIIFYDPSIMETTLPYFREERLKFANELNKWLGWKL